MSKFRLGDVCEMHSLEDWRAAYNGTECCIAGGLQERYGDTSKKWKLCYRVHCALDNKYWLVEPQHLRLRRPPSWDRWIYQTDDVRREHERQYQLERLQKIIDEERA